MSKSFFLEMMIPEPDINLEVGSASHGRQTGEMLTKIEEILFQVKPDFVMVYGDTNSTLAGALAASKLNIPVAHVEAGLRSFKKDMPEEQNRILTDHLSSLLFCPTETAKENLSREGITEGVEVVGDVMYDAHLFYRELLRESRGNSKYRKAINSMHNKEFNGKSYLLTLHRAENTDDPSRLKAIVESLNNLHEFRGIFPIHPRTRKALKKNKLRFESHIHQIKAVGFIDMLQLEGSCDFIVTDSGGVQKEAFFFRKPCITLRDQTEWVETVESGWNTLVGSDREKIIYAFKNVHSPLDYPSFYGNGHAGKKILNKIIM